MTALHSTIFAVLRLSSPTELQAEATTMLWHKFSTKLPLGKHCCPVSTARQAVTVQAICQQRPTCSQTTHFSAS
jgi:hypothetical protein